MIGGTKYGNETLTYTYDALDRLLSETKNGQKTSYTYDSMGNRLTKTQNRVTTSYVYDLCNKLLSETTNGVETTYVYDAIGNLTEKTDGTGTTTYAYNALNQLVEVVNPDGTWQSNTYDASGIRSMIAENGVTTEFMTFNGLVLSGYNKDGEQTEHYFYGNSLLAAEYGRNAYEEADLYYYLKNSHGDVIGLTDTTGTLTQNYRYDAFGTLTGIKSVNENGVLKGTATALSRFLYAGEQYDKVTGLYYLRARQYDTVLGRFIQEDTYLGDGRNLYVYVSNNPLKYVDPSGYEKTGGYNFDAYNKTNIHMSYASLVTAPDRKKEAEKEARKELILNGSLNTVKGAMETAAGALVTTACAAVTPAHPVIGVTGATAGLSYASVGISNMSEGIQDIYNGITGNVDVEAFNLTRDIFFAGNQTYYNQAEVYLGAANFIYGVGLSSLPTALPSSGSITEYANAGSQLMDFMDAVVDDKGYTNLIPDNESIIGHLFRNAEGHIDDTIENRNLLESVANALENFLGIDKYGNEWYSELLEDGKQVWVEVGNGKIFEGGINEIPKIFNSGTGFKKP